MAKSVTGGGGSQGMNWSGKENRRAAPQTVAGGKTSREMGGWGPGVLAQTPPGTTSRSLVSKFSTAYKPGDYAAYRKTLPGFVAVAKGKKPATPVAVAVKPPAKKPVVKPTAVVSNVTREKLSPTKAAPTRMAVNARTGNTTGFTTGKTTGTSASKPGVAGKTYQSAGDRLKTNAMNRTNQPAGPMGGGGGGRSSSGGGSSSRSSSSGGLQSKTERDSVAGPKRG